MFDNVYEALKALFERSTENVPIWRADVDKRQRPTMVSGRFARFLT